jgi:hypothetical protein
MIYNMVLDSQMGPHELEVRQLPDGTVELHLPRMIQPFIIKNNAMRVSINVPGPPVPISITADWSKKS